MKHLTSVIALVGLVVAGGCGGGSADPPGSVTVRWQLGGFSCTEAGVPFVRISVISAVGIEDSVVVPCQSQNSSATLPGILPGMYTIQVEGLPSADATYATYTGSVPGVRVPAGGLVQVPLVELSENPGAIDLTWFFENGKLCGTNGVDSVSVYIWDSHAKKVCFTNPMGQAQCSLTYACDLDDAQVAAERADPAVALKEATGVLIEGLYAGTYKLRVFAFKQGENVYKHFAEVSPSIDYGRVTPVEVELKSCTDAASICFQ